MDISKRELRVALMAERQKLIELISESTEEEMSQSSLCEGWTNKNVIGHILGYELGFKDAMKLIFNKDSLDSINNDQAKRFENENNHDLIKLLLRGQKRVLRLLSLTPKRLLNRKIIRVPHGGISIAQLFGDLVMDRAIHYLDIANPLLNERTFTNKGTLNTSLGFILKSVDLLNSSIPEKYYGTIALIRLSGSSLKNIYWEIGTDKITEQRPEGDLLITVVGNADDFLFTIVGRKTLIKKALVLKGESELKRIFNESLNANKLWEN